MAGGVRLSRLRHEGRAADRPPASPKSFPVGPRTDRAWHGWVMLAGVLALAALIGQAFATDTIDWQPARVGAEGWRAFSAVAVHYSGLHLAANLGGTVAVAALGWAARLPWRCTMAWAMAWPLTQLGLLVQPALLHYGGLSGVLHAGVAVAGLHLGWRASGRQRVIGVAMLVVLAAKVLSESPWGPPLRHPDGWDIAVAPLAHASGLLAGLACAATAEAWAQLRMRRTSAVVE